MPFKLLICALIALPVGAYAAEGASNVNSAPVANNAQAVSAYPEMTAEDKELKELKSNLDRISYSNKLFDEKVKEQMRADNERLLKLSTDNKLLTEQQKKELADLTAKYAKMKAESDIVAEQNRAKKLQYDAEQLERDMEIKRLEYAEKKMKHETDLLKAESDKLEIEIKLRSKKDEWKKEANTEPVYLSDPFDPKTGTLTISDRRIAMNYMVTSLTADQVSERIEYFNNISTAPIFIVIDTNYGGSVRAGYNIIKAMESSRAPVYVVVKSFAASMAAVITTMAEKSYIYPHAMMLHHQMSSGTRGNMTQMKEALEAARELDRRINTPVAKKMGLTLDQFRKKMYEHYSDGDWEEYGDNAVKLKWAGTVVNRIEETGVVKRPGVIPSIGYASMSSQQLASDEKTDANGNKYVTLPRIDPFDYYYMYNPDNYFR